VGLTQAFTTPSKLIPMQTAIFNIKQSPSELTGAMADKSITGPVHAVSHNPTTNTAFTRTLGNVLSRPTIFSIPKIIIKLPLGDELANAAILSSTHVIPERLIKMGYKFRFPYLESVLRHTLGKSMPGQYDQFVSSS